MHFTRTFFPRRSLQTTSIILSGATQCGGCETAESGRQGPPRPQDLWLPRFLFISRPHPHSHPEETADPRPPRFWPPLAGRWTVDGQVPSAFPGSGPLHLAPLTSKRLEPTDATTSSVESRAAARVDAENRKRKRAAEGAGPSGAGRHPAALFVFRALAWACGFLGTALGSRGWAGGDLQSVLMDRGTMGRGATFCS